MSFSRRGKTHAGVILAMAVLGFFATHFSALAQGGGALYLSPSSTQRNVGDAFSVSVRVNTGGQAINAADGSIVFDPARLQVTSISKSGSVFTLWTTEPTYSNSDGTVTFGGGLPSPGYSGSAGQIITLNFKAKTSGSTEVTFVSGDILANDGSGTNILDSLGKATYTIGSSTPTTAPVPGLPVLGTTQLGAPNISSTTNPDQTRWYRNSSPLFEWQVPAAATEVRLVLGQHNTSAPRVRYVPAISQKNLPDTGDGVWYFNAQFANAQGLGPIGSLRFNIDTRPPEPFTVTRVDAKDPTEPQPKILSATTDTLSGIDRYDLQIAGKDVPAIPESQVGITYALPIQLPGTRTLTVRAVDMAGNTTTSSLEFTVAPISSPTITEYPTHVSARTEFTVSGHGTPGTQVLLYASLGSKVPELTDPNDAANQVGSTRVDSAGDWHVQSISLASGVENVVAYSRDDRGATSLPSNAISISVGSAVIGWIIPFMKLLLTGILHVGSSWFFISLVFYIILISMLVDLILHWFGALIRHRKEEKNTKKPSRKKSEALIPMLAAVFAYWLKVRRQRREAHRKAVLLRKHEVYANKKMDALIANMKEELALLEKIRDHRPLDPKEEHLQSVLLESHKALAKKK